MYSLLHDVLVQSIKQAEDWAGVLFTGQNWLLPVA